MSWDVIGALGNAFGGPVGGLVASGIGSYLSGNAQKDAAQTAADAQMSANRAALAQQQQQFGQSLGFQQGLLGQANGMGQQQLGQLQSLFAPFAGAAGQGLAGLGQFAQAGLGGYQNALQGQQALAGALGPGAQSQAIAGIQNGPLFGSLAKQGEDAILQTASATGGLRGGNTQAALAQFRPQLLNQLIQQQFSNLGGIAGLGAQGAQGFSALGQQGLGGASAQAQGGLGVLQSQLGLAGQVGANVGSLSNSYGNSITDLLGQQGAIGAGNALAQGRANAGLYSGIGNNLSQWALLNQLRGWGGLAGSASPYTAGLPSNDASAMDALKGWGF